MVQKKTVPKEIINPALSQDMQKIKEQVSRLEVPHLSASDKNESNPSFQSERITQTPQSLKQISKTILEIPEPPKPKEIVVPTIKKGPLFISENKFFEAENLVHQMKDFSNELENKINIVRESLQEDFSTIAQLESLISEVEDKVSSLKKIVSP